MNDNLFQDIEEFLRNPENSPRLITEEQIQLLILSLAEHRLEEGFTEDEAVALVRWAERQVLGHTLLELLLKGYIWVDDPTGKFGDDDITMGLTAVGQDYTKLN